MFKSLLSLTFSALLVAASPALAEGTAPIVIKFSHVVAEDTPKGKVIRARRAATTKDTFKGALYFATASIGAGTTAYSATGEVGNHLVLMCRVSEAASGGLTPSETLTLAWDEI